jgi:oligosaccharide repeat unit polymerase
MFGDTKTHVQRQSGALVFMGVLSLVLSGAALISGLGWENRDILIEFGLLSILGFACLLPAIVAVVKRNLDLFEPVHMFALASLVYFVLVPVVLIEKNAFRLIDVDYRSALPKSLALALIALAAFYVGYYFRYSRQVGSFALARNDAGYETLSYVQRHALLLLAFFIGLVVLWIIVARFPLRALWVFGGASYGDAFQLAKGIQIGYLYGAREALPACLLLLIASRRTERWPLLSVFLLILIGLFFIGTGGRTRALLLVLSVFAFYHLERQEKPALWQILVLVFLVFYIIVGSMGFYRGLNQGMGRSLQRDAFTIGDAWDTLIEGSQISITTALIVEYVPEQVDYFWGASYLNLFTQPIPRFLWPGKPREIIVDDTFIGLWPRGTAMPFWLGFYLNFGPVGVVLGMALLGWLSRIPYESLRQKPEDTLAQVSVALYYPWMIHLYGRGGLNPGYLVYSVVYVFLPVWIMRKLLKRRADRAHIVSVPNRVSQNRRLGRQPAPGNVATPSQARRQNT